MMCLYREDAPWEPDRRGLGLGRGLYWLASTIAVVILVFAIVNLFISWAQGRPILHVVGFAAAAVVWLIGRLCRLFSH